MYRKLRRFRHIQRTTGRVNVLGNYVVDGLHIVVMGGLENKREGDQGSKHLKID